MSHWLGVFEMGQGNKTGFFKDVEDRNPVLTGRFHTDFGTVVFGKPVRQLPETFRKGREASLLILSKTVGICNAYAGIDPSFVDIKTTTVSLNLSTDEWEKYAENEMLYRERALGLVKTETEIIDSLSKQYYALKK